MARELFSQKIEIREKAPSENSARMD